MSRPQTTAPCTKCRKAPVHGHGLCHRCHSAAWMRERRANFPIATCTVCRHDRPIERQREGWCTACVTRWRKAGRPESGPPPLDLQAVAAARTANAGHARAVQQLDEAIRDGGWEWASDCSRAYAAPYRDRKEAS